MSSPQSIANRNVTADSARPETKAERATFAKVRRAEVEYATQLRKIARHVGDIIRGYPLGDPAGAAKLQKALEAYSILIRPWARTTAQAMLANVSRRDEQVWAEISKTMGLALRREIRSAPTGQMLRTMLEEQVVLITSLPIEAGERVHQLTLKGLESASRGAEVFKEIMRSGEVTASRATLIARTEIGRVASGLTMARAVHIGSEGYIWRNVGDADVRPLHRSHNRGGIADQFYRWNDPPVSGEKGERSLPGAIYNCRCYPEVVIPDDFD